SQPNPPPATIASSAAWHRSERSPRDSLVTISTLVSGFGISLIAGIPVQKAFDQSQPNLLPLLGMELYAQQVVAPDYRRHRSAIFDRCQHILRPFRDEVIGVDEVGMVAGARRGQRRVLNILEPEIAPAHLRDTQ